MGEQKNLSIHWSGPVSSDLQYDFIYFNARGDPQLALDALVIEPLPALTIPPGAPGAVQRRLVPRTPGRVYIGLNQTGTQNATSSLRDTLCDVLVMHYAWLDIVQIVIGWMYFAAWTVSFYPQVFLNWRRKSVVGLNLDFLVLNIVGFLVYSVFNVALFASPVLKQQYANIHPLSVIPVQPNDIFFSVHALFISLVTAIQALIYERGGQRVSRVCLAILGLIGVYCVINVIVAAVNVMTWLTFVFNLSYVKLFITFIKYIPQAVMNCRRRSTVGWSIGNICLDLAGGVLSILQMFVIAYNFDDWSNVFGSPTKLGLGLFSILFDVFFMAQHWCLFRNRHDRSDTVSVSSSSSPSSPTSYPVAVLSATEPQEPAEKSLPA